mgnify:FL=1
MNLNKLKNWVTKTETAYQQIENYFKNGSFGVKFYPFLMSPCVRLSHQLVVKFIAILSIFVGIYYLFGEFITILFSQSSLSSYVTHSTLELLQPAGTIIEEKSIHISPLAFTMQASFLLQGGVFAVIYLLGTIQISHRFRLFAAICAILCSGGFLLASSVQSGKLVEHGLQNLGASLTFLVGNLTMIFAGLGMSKEQFPHLKRYSLVAGMIGVLAIVLSLGIDLHGYFAIVERLSIYAIMIWEIKLGFSILEKVKK